MSTSLFLLSMSLAVIGPLLAVSYLKPILHQVLRTLCDAQGSAEFWVRCAYLLAVCGTVLLMLSFGEFGEAASVVDTLRRAFWLVFAGVFLTVAVIARQIWGQVQQLLTPPAPLSRGAAHADSPSPAIPSPAELA